MDTCADRKTLEPNQVNGGLEESVQRLHDRRARSRMRKSSRDRSGPSGVPLRACMWATNQYLHPSRLPKAMQHYYWSEKLPNLPAARLGKIDYRFLLCLFAPQIGERAGGSADHPGSLARHRLECMTERPLAPNGFDRVGRL